MEFFAVAIVAFLFGIASAPFGIALGLPPALVALGVFTGCAAFAGTATAVLWRQRDQLVARRPGWVGIAVPVVGWMWRRAGTRVTGPQATAVTDRATSILDGSDRPARACSVPCSAAGHCRSPAARSTTTVDGCSPGNFDGVAIWSTVLVVGFHQLITAPTDHCAPLTDRTRPVTPRQGSTAHVATATVSGTTTQNARTCPVQHHLNVTPGTESTLLPGCFESEREILRWILTDRGVTLS